MALLMGNVFQKSVNQLFQLMQNALKILFLYRKKQIFTVD